MAWRLTIGGVDHTAIVDSFTTTVALNDRARGTVVVADVMPARYAELVSYAADGITPLFGGVILQRSLQGRNQADPTYQLTLEVGDWLTYADWCYSTKAYPVAVTLKTVLADLVAEHLARYGITLDPAQVDGPTIAPFTWTDKRVADALRELSDRTKYVVKIDPAKRLRMFVPATLPAPVALTEATPHCQEITWRDAERTPYNTILLRCGPAGPADLDDERHHGDGVTRSWPLNAPFIKMIGALSVFSEGGGGYPVGIYGVDDQPWTVDLATNTMRQRADQPVIAAGDYWWIKYQAQFPFTVTRTTGATPIVEHSEAREDVLSIPVGEEIADTLLAQAQEAPREATITTDVDGFIPGQALTIALATTRAIAGTFLINSVSLTIVQDTDQGDRFWQYTLEAVESPIYQGSDLDGWRELAGVGGGTTTTSGGADGPPGPAGPPGPPGPPGTATLPALLPGGLFVGDAASVATAVPMSGDVALAAGGAATVVHVANAATTATPSVVPDTIMSRDAAADSSCATFRAGRVETPTIGSLGSSVADLTISPGQHLLLNPAGYIIDNPGGAGGYVLPQPGYRVQLGALHQKYLAIHVAEIWSESLVAQQTITTIGGSVLVAPTTVLTQDLAPGANSMYVKHNGFQLHVPGVELGSKLVLRSAGKYEACAVIDTSVPVAQPDGSFLYQVLRDQDGTGSNQWYAGDAVVDTGKSTTTSGLIDLYAVSGLLPGSGFGPAIVGNVRTGINPSDMEPRWAIGNLNTLYGYSGDIFGAAFGVPTGAWVKIDPVNGVRLGHNATTVTQIDAAGNASFSGRITAAAGTVGGWNIIPNYLYAPLANTSIALNSSVPSIEIGDPRPTSWGAPVAGIWMGNEGGVYKFRACSANGLAGMFWDGAVATFRGEGSGVTNIHGGNIQTGTIGADKIVANSITGGQIAGDTITAAHLAAGSVTASELAAGAVTATAILARSITADRIVVGALTATEIAANTITADRLNIGALSAITANLGTVTAGAITGVSITGNTITGGTINGTTITGVDISGSRIVAGSGNTIVLDSNGLQIAEGNGTGSARIILGGQSLFCESAKITMDGNFHAKRDINVDQDLYVARNTNVTGYISVGGQIAMTPPAAVAGGTRAVYFNFANNCLCFWTGAAAADEAADQPWTAAIEALAARVQALEGGA